MNVSDLSPAEFHLYYKHYIDLADGLNIIDGLTNGMHETIAFIESVPSQKLEYRYEEGKWTIKEIIRHIIDTEKIFAYRALRFARKDPTPLPGFEQDDYIVPAYANALDLKSLLEEYKTNRLSTISMFSNFTETMLTEIGKASKNPLSVRAAGFIISGHEIHHCNVIRDRYL